MVLMSLSAAAGVAGVAGVAAVGRVTGSQDNGQWATPTEPALT